VYAGLDGTTPGWLGRPMLAIGVGVSVVGMYAAGRRVGRSRYRPAPWRWPELVVAGSGLVVGVAGWWMSRHQLEIAYPSVSVAPALSLLAMAVAAAGLAGALCAPPAAVPPGGAA
jgi:energy-coupling factor transport system permease protein